MPSKSEAQRKFMQAAAHDPAFAEKHHIPQEVAREFFEADRAIAHAVRQSHPAASSPPKVASTESIGRQLASYNVGGLTDRPTQPPSDQVYEFKTF